MSSPHSPLPAGIVPSKASALVPNFAAAFLEAAVCFLAVQHAGSVFAFDCAPTRGAPIPAASAVLATVTTAHRWSIFLSLIFQSHPGGSRKVYSKANTLRFLRFLMLGTN